MTEHYVCFFKFFSITLKLFPDEDVLMKTVVSSALSFFRIENYQHQTPSPFSQTFLHTFFRYCEFPLKPTSDSCESRWGKKIPCVSTHWQTFKTQPTLSLFLLSSDDTNR